MSTLSTTYVKHGSSAINNITLASTGAVAVNGAMTGAGMDLIVSQSFTSATAISINNCFSSTYENYKIVMSSTSTSGQAFYGYFRSGGVNKTSSLYNYASFYYNQGSSSGNQGVGASASSMTMGIAGGSALANIEIYSPFVSSLPTQFYTNYRYSSTSTSAESTGGFFHGYYASSESHDGIYLWVTTGTWTGNIRVYGYKNS